MTYLKQFRQFKHAMNCETLTKCDLLISSDIVCLKELNDVFLEQVEVLGANMHEYGSLEAVNGLSFRAHCLSWV